MMVRTIDKRMVIVFDFDKTISDERLHSLCKKMRKENNEVWIVTARKENDFNIGVISPALNKMFVPMSNVIFCNEKPKEEMLQMVNADIYIDNISDEFESIIEHTNTIPLLWLGQ